MGHLADLHRRFSRARANQSKGGAASIEALHDIWSEAGLPDVSLEHVALRGAEPVLPSSFAVGTAAQVSIAAAGLAAAEIWHLRGRPRQQVAVDMLAAAQECRSHFVINGVPPDLWDKLSGSYRCGDGGWVRIHANFAHHRDGALALLGCPAGATREDVAQALQRWKALEFEQVAADAGLVVAAMRSFHEWDALPQAAALAGQALVSIERIGDADPRPWPKYGPEARPLQGIRVLDLTRIIAGPVGGRTLAAYGADVMLVNSPHLPNIDNIIDTSRGKLSAHADLETADGRIALGHLLRSAHVFMQGYRPGGMQALGFGPQEVARIRPGIVYASLSAYGPQGPWAARRGFDSLVQTATGFNQAEAEAAGQSSPKPLPMQILDYASGFLMAFGVQAALARQATEGGSWHVRVSLARTGLWLRRLGRVPGGLSCPMPEIGSLLETSPSGFGDLSAVPHAARFSLTPAGWARPSVPPGTHPAAWPSP
ncbi:CoA transferase [Bordetella avium]|uniref:CoA transferase n=1 Tax=Bordetella avium TaxID=521 RepID=UPI0039FBDC94